MGKSSEDDVLIFLKVVESLGGQLHHIKKKWESLSCLVEVVVLFQDSITSQRSAVMKVIHSVPLAPSGLLGHFSREIYFCCQSIEDYTSKTVSYVEEGEGAMLRRVMVRWNYAAAIPRNEKSEIDTEPDTQDVVTAVGCVYSCLKSLEEPSKETLKCISANLLNGADELCRIARKGLQSAVLCEEAINALATIMAEAY